jgi:sialate O-acetylesterase/unsaturated rhamnogalacturonyl hydrolase
MNTQLKTLVILLIFLSNIQIIANVKLPAVISDNMVLQQNTNVVFWGKASPSEKITIKPSWGGLYSISANADSTWSIKIKTPSASSGQSITIEASNTIQIKNVLIGEVWLCSGQSNMDFPVAKATGWRTGIVNEEEEMKDADYPEIRLFHVTQRLSPEAELDYCEGHWDICNKETLKEFSAVAFFFGRKLYKELHMPVGLIQSTWGGTPAEAWTKMSVMERDTVYAPLVKDFYASRDNYQADLEKYEKEKVTYDKIMADSLEKNKEQMKKPQKPQGINHNKALSTLWNAMIHPLVPYTIKGVIWYQGESNSIRHWNYTHVLTNMINSWRQEWNQGEFPFYFVQIAPQYKQPPQIREAQLKTWQSVKNTGMVVITDAGDSTDIHPRNKKIPGERLAYWALAKNYGKNIPFSGPVYKSMQIKKNKAILTFDYAINGLKINENTLKGFVIAGTDKVFYPAAAVIHGNKLEISAPQVNAPVAVRYGWDFFIRANLYNGADLPASPFRTDNWNDKN